MQNKLHDIALQLAGRVSAALRGVEEGSEVELDTGACGCGSGCFWPLGVGPAFIQYLGSLAQCEAGSKTQKRRSSRRTTTATGWPSCVAVAGTVVRQRSFKREQKWEPAIMQ